jgi:hypothetical protein
MELWTDLLDQGLAFDCIYSDFAKAFDRVPHKRLIEKLKAYGIKGNLLVWIENFLSNRNQCVTINNVSSDTIEVTSGIPQGSVLGPILFIIFINDLPDVLNSYVKIFADDTKIFNVIQSVESYNILQEDIRKIIDWTDKWQLYFNRDKCKIIHYGRNNLTFEYFMNNHKVEVVDFEKDLGVTFDRNLKFSAHIKNIVNKANSRLGIIKRNFSDLSAEIFLPLYKSLVRPLLEYCSSIWYPILK